ncbi:GAF domain-containing protein [Streptomyces sp. NPDC046275]|uniref:GAF domain-containing protein n=1 Tax=Streptomyces sp. NPDC046275 TaxID=3157201 RepID=UPI0033F13D49
MQPRWGFRELERGTVLVTNDRRDYLGFLGDVPQATRMIPDDLHASIGAALVARGRVLGYVQVFRTRRPHAFTGHDAKLLKEIITRAALGIDNARRYTRERRVAETLQRSLLPPVSSRTAAAETAGIYLPPRGEAGVGGDWFDAIALSSLRPPWWSATSSGTAWRPAPPWPGCAPPCRHSPTWTWPPTNC